MKSAMNGDMWSETRGKIIRRMSQTYYFLKPIIPWAIKVEIRRLIANRLRRLFSGSWPILPSAARPPGDWPGWPNGKRFAFVMTHDVEGTRGLARCRKLAELEKAFGIRSSFNFVPEGEYRVPDTVRALLEHEGFEVGVHDLYHDGSLYRSLRQFEKQAPRVNQYLKVWAASGFRSGYMFHNLEWLQGLDMLYDASTFDTDPFEPQPEGVGTIFPFWVQCNGSKGYVELPYTLPQDSTLFVLFKETTIDLWTKKLDWVASHGGMALAIVHPDYISFDGKPNSQEYSVDLYERFLKYVLNRYGDACWYALPREVAAFAAQFKPRLVHGTLTSDRRFNDESVT
jgi:peptidoglycan/xylan/chitin deacetylase (PgdA/CDA1 family)